MANQTATDTAEDMEEVLTSDVMSDQEIQAIKNKTVVGAFSYFIRTGILQGIGLVSAAILSAYFSPEDFGVYGFVTQIIGLLIFFSDIGLSASLIQKKEQPKLRDFRTAFTIQQLLSWLIVLVSLVITATGFVENKVGSEGQWILLALAVSFPLASVKTISSIKLNRDLEFSKLVLPQILEQITFHGLLIVLAMRGVGVMAYTWAILARAIIGMISMLIIKPWRIGVAFDWTSFKDLVSFGAKFQLNDFLARVKDQLFYLALGSFLPLQQFGFIQWAKTWSMYPYNLTVQNVMAITFPTFSRLQKRPALLKKAIEKSIFFISISIFPILVGMSIFIQPLTHVFPQYAKWQPAIPSFVMFALSVGWAAISTPLVNTLNAIGKINKSLKLMVIWTLLTWILTPILIWQVGFNGVALAALIISFTSYLAIILVKREIDVDIWQSVRLQLLAALLMAAVGFMGLNYWSQGLTQLLLGGLVVGLSYFAALALFGYQRIKTEIVSLRS